MVRFANADDDLSLLSTKAASVLAREQILVSVNTNRVDGLIVLFDAGHRVLYVDSLLVAAGAPRSTTIELLDGVLAYCKEQGITDFFCTSSSESLKSLALHHGATFTDSNHYLAFVPVK